MLNVPLVRSQFRGAEVVWAICIHRQGERSVEVGGEWRRGYRIALITWIEAQYLIDAQTPPATNTPHLLKDKFTPSTAKCLINIKRSFE